MGRIRQSGGLKAPDKAEEGEGGDDDEEEALPDVTEFRPQSGACRAGATATVTFIIPQPPRVSPVTVSSALFTVMV